MIIIHTGASRITPWTVDAIFNNGITNKVSFGQPGERSEMKAADWHIPTRPSSDDQTTRPLPQWWKCFWPNMETLASIIYYMLTFSLQMKHLIHGERRAFKVGKFRLFSLHGVHDLCRWGSSIILSMSVCSEICRGISMKHFIVLLFHHRIFVCLSTLGVVIWR